MALNVWNNPDFLKLKGEIIAEAKKPDDKHPSKSKMDEFFWLKAAAMNDTGELRLFRDVKPDGSGEPYRIANIVLQGGGVLGLAHAGFVTGLELAGVRFAGIAGASAGAIMAMGLAAVRGKNLLDPTHEKVVEIVGGMPMSAFIDGPFRTRRLIKQFLLKRISLLPSAWPAWLGALRQILRKRGLNPGNAFEDWLRGVLAENGLRTVDELFNTLRDVGKQLRDATTASPEQALFASWQLGDDKQTGDKQLGEDLLQIMAACTPVGVKFQFPRDVRYLSVETNSNSPAALVRASMSIPLFFEPALFDVNKKTWESFISVRLAELVDKDKHDEFAGIDQVAFLDGGIFSNLPVDAFRLTMPDVPTVAVPLMSTTLAKPYQRRARLSSLVTDVGTVAFMIRNQRDRDAIDQLREASKRFEARREQEKDDDKKWAMPPSYPFRLATLNVGSTNWLNFVMDEIEMMDLFLIGMNRAKGFIQNEMKGEK
ncbi:patatin-like phospholipase family protein [Mesorhizobium sp. M0862]|uniref:patatin-like phospholipase family protein n=1 Tax=Mesorhizobium sp. M0862 TaxID=2957015 RepID=UPI0033393B3C